MHFVPWMLQLFAPVLPEERSVETRVVGTGEDVVAWLMYFFGGPGALADEHSKY